MRNGLFPHNDRRLNSLYDEAPVRQGIGVATSARPDVSYYASWGQCEMIDKGINNARVR